MPKGPPPKARALRVLDGNAGRRPVNHREPQPKKSAPKCPSWLSANGKRHFRATLKELDAMGVLTQADGQAIACYAASYARYIECLQDIADKGESAVTDKGYEYVRPQVGIAARLVQQIRMYQAELGLTPASRSRVKIETDNQDPLDDFLDGKTAL